MSASERKNMNDYIKPPEEIEPIDDKKLINEFESTVASQSKDEEKPVDDVQKPKKSHKKLIKILVYILLIALIAGASAGAAYYWRDKTANDAKAQQDTEISALEKEKASLKKQLADAKADTTTTTTNTTTCTAIAPTAAVVENIKLSITSGNTVALEGYMATSVNVILAATEAYGPQTPTQAVSDITSFISSATSPWDFALPAATLTSYRDGGYGADFPTIAVVGKSANGKVISFSFDCNAKINKVFMAASGELL